jgi:hypothetical protein
MIDFEEPCLCGSRKKFKNCCLKKSTLGYHLNLKGKKAEEILYQLSVRSFLIDWCFRNPKLPNGKEICDLLIVYDDIVVIWQIKDLKLQENRKYKVSEVQKNLKQLITAKNRLFNLKIPIYIKNQRRSKIKFEPTQIKEIYLSS